MTREELQRLYSECVSRAFRAEQLAGLVRGVESFLAGPDPTVEIAYLKAKLADLSDEYPTRRTQGRRPPGEYLLSTSFPTWADAMAFADRLARFIRTSHQITEGTDR